jgi:putative nucleotidyltransferase with HDIG domain
VGKVTGKVGRQAARALSSQPGRQRTVTPPTEDLQWDLRKPGPVRPTRSSIRELLLALDDHDPYTHGHSLRVAGYASLLARLLGFDDESIDLVRRAALVHDVGKQLIPMDVLGKTGPLDEAEFDLIKQHPILGSSLLEEHDLKPLIPMVLHHHERWDGRGYPTGLAGVDIPVESRIILVVDAFDAMTTNRPYGRVLSEQEAISEIGTCAGKQFDPLIARAMRYAYSNNLL